MRKPTTSYTGILIDKLAPLVMGGFALLGKSLIVGMALSPVILAALWYHGIVSFEAFVVVTLLVVVYFGRGGGGE